jgi:hypothetical protein
MNRVIKLKIGRGPVPAGLHDAWEGFRGARLSLSHQSAVGDLQQGAQVLNHWSKS